MTDSFLLICCIVMGLCTAGAAFCGRDAYGQAIDFVQKDLADRLKSLRIVSNRLRLYINVWICIVLAVFFGLWIGLDSFLLGGTISLLMAAGPWYVIRKLAIDRRQKIEDQLADSMVMFSSGVRAGLSIAQSLELLGRECPRPINQEFQQIYGEYKLGKPLEKTLTEAKNRLRSENFLLFAAALMASRESGGRLNETVERISTSVLELQRLERKVMAETAQARKSAVYMAIAPALLLIVYFFVDPENTTLLFQTLPGQAILSICLVLNVVAYLWSLKILNPDI